MEFVCFCGEKAKTFGSKNGEAIFTCGKAIDFTKMRQVLKMRKSIEKDEALQELDLGCNMRIKEFKLNFLKNEQDEPIERKRFPKCEHKLLTRLGISTSDRNNGRIYFSCNVKVPDIPCDFFKWFDECDDSEESIQSKRKHQEEEEEEEEEEKEQRTKKFKPKLSRKKQKHL